MHGLEKRSDGTYSYVGAREEAWHRLGVTYADRDGLTVAEVLKDLDVGQIITSPVEAPFVTPYGVTRVVDPSKKMTARLRGSHVQPLGVVGSDYTVIDETEGFSFLDKVTENGEASISAAGLLFDGKRAFCTFKLPEEILIGGVDAHHLFGVVSLSHDGSTAYMGAVTPIRAVCQNTVAMGLKAAKRVWKVRHTKGAKLEVAQARQALDVTFAYADAWNVAAEKLMAAHVSDAKFEKIISSLYEPTEPGVGKVTWSNWETKRNELMFLFTQADTQEAVRGTAWGAYNAIIEWQDWMRPVRGADDAKAAQFTRAIYEPGSEKADALSAIKELVLV